jgi:hypothetical protein
VDQFEGDASCGPWDHGSFTQIDGRPSERRDVRIAVAAIARFGSSPLALPPPQYDQTLARYAAEIFGLEKL